jgi:RNA polymerase sigma-70 factor (sigma-E family)
MHNLPSFDAYVTERQQQLLRFAMVLTGDSRLAEDVVADVLGRAFERWDAIGSLGQPHAYVRRMVVNEYLSWRRKFSRVRSFEDLAGLDSPVADATNSHAERAEMLARLRALPRQQRAAVVLRYYEGLSDDEIASALNCRTGTVRSHISHGLAALRIQLTFEAAGGRHPETQET